MTRHRALRGLLVAVAGMLVLAAGSFLFVFHTDPGRDWLRRLLVARLNGQVHGRVTIARLEGRLPGEVVLRDIALTDSAGSLVLGVGRMAARINVLELFSKRIDVSQVTFEDPTLVLRHRRGGGWNVARVFARPDRGGARSANGFGHWVRIADARVRGAHVTVRVPWTADSGLAPARRDSAVAAALAGETRARVERTQHGPEQVMEFRRLDADLPRVLLAHPDTARIVVEVARASMIAEPFRPPAADIRELSGALTVTSDSLHFIGWRVVFPRSRMAIDVRYTPRTRAVQARLRADPLVFDDLRWLYPALPPDALGAVTLEVARAEGGDLDIRGTSIAARSGPTELTGTFGLTLGDSPRLHHTDLRVRNLDTELAERLVPRLALPVAGTIDAQARVDGPLAALRTDARITLRERHGAASVVWARGELRTGPSSGARALRLRLEPLQASLIRSVAPSFPLRGSLAGDVTVSGTMTSGWRFDGDIAHVNGVERSRVVGTGRVGAGGHAFGLDARVLPLSLATVGRAAAAWRPLGLHGTASGTVRASGTRDSVTFRGSLRLADGGLLDAAGHARRAASGIGYDVTVRPTAVDPHTVSTRLPTGALTGIITARGSGTDPGALRAELSAVLDRARLGRAEVDSLRLHARAADGVASVDTAAAWGPAARVAASGTFGLVAERQGTLRYAVRADSLQSVLQWIPTGVTDSTPWSGAAAGAVAAEGVLRGNVDAVRTVGRASMRDVTARGATVAGITMAYTLGLRGDDTLAVAAALDTVGVRRLAYEHAEIGFDGSRRGGAADVRVRQGERVDFAVRGDVTIDSARAAWDDSRGTTVLVRELSLRLDSASWRAARPATIAWRGGTLRVDSLAVSRGGGGSLAAHGVLPATGDGTLTLSLTDAPLADAAVLAQSEPGAAGRVSLDARVGGTTAAPRATIDARLADGVVRGDTIPDVHAALSYGDGALAGRAEMGDGSAPLLRADGRVAVNLALSRVRGPRVARDAPLRLDVRADSLPLVMLPRRAEVEVLGGWARGEVTVRGTLDEPDALGHAEVRGGLARVPQLGATLRDIVAGARLASDSLVLDSLVAWSGGPIRAEGSVLLARDAPRRVSATLTARDAAVLDGSQGLLHADADFVAAGTTDSLIITGRAEVLHGFVERKGPAEQALHVVPTGDPELFAIVDTSAAARRSSEPPRARPSRSAHADLTIRIHPGVWYRSAPNAKVEVETARDLRVRADLATGELAMGGLVVTRGGIYVFRMRPFSIVRGAATLPGVAGVAPALEVTGEHDVWIAGRGVLPVRILVGGSPGDVRFSLGDASTLPAAPRDLPAYLSLGRSPVSLLQTEGTSLAGLSTSGGRLTGELGALARRQEVSQAVGAVLYQLGKGARDAAGIRLFTATSSDLPPELAESPYGGVRGTVVEAGYLIGSRTYLATRLRFAAVTPGLVLVQGLGAGLELRAGYEPRFLVGQPTLGSPRRGLIRGTLGAFLAREWGF